ncbi:MAG: hypothetical protein CM15mP32_0850 [Flavobacteriaceae bacterium]|nr:MAG: hypothetical protein CM15mP32_0850 [Flavobacteriaceae bacterium]
MFCGRCFSNAPKRSLVYPSKGSFNLHASLLPKYRGAALIHWAIINGEEETGVTTFLLMNKSIQEKSSHKSKQLFCLTKTQETLAIG